MNFEPHTGELKTLLQVEFVHLELERREKPQDMTINI